MKDSTVFSSLFRYEGYQNAELAKLVKDAMRYRWLREAQVIDWDCLNSRCVGDVEHSDAAWDEVGVRIDETVDWAMRSNDRVEGRDAASSRRVPSHDGLCGNGSEVGAGDTAMEGK